MIDLDKVAAAADTAVLEGRDHVRVSPSWLQQVIHELEEARRAQGRLGQAYGLPEGKRF